jgi:HlyD family secretion protein
VVRLPGPGSNDSVHGPGVIGPRWFDRRRASSACDTIGDAYRVEVRIVVWEAQNVLTVPTSARFREGNQWAVYRIVDGRAQRTTIGIGHQTGREAEITTGLDVGDRVIVHPGDAHT